jgi:hypothetical protein
MSSTITIEFEEGTIGISREKWDTWARDHGLNREPRRTLYYAGAGMTRVEIDYHSEQRVTFSTFHMGPGLYAVAALALELWTQFGGTLSASPELALHIWTRFAFAGEFMKLAAKLAKSESG